MIRNLFDTFSVLGLIAGMSLSLALITKFPISGMIIFAFLAVFSLVSLVNASND